MRTTVRLTGNFMSTTVCQNLGEMQLKFSNEAFRGEEIFEDSFIKYLITPI